MLDEMSARNQLILLPVDALTVLTAVVDRHSLLAEK